MKKISTSSSSSTKTESSFSSLNQKNNKQSLFSLNSFKKFSFTSSIVLLISYLVILALNNSTTSFLLPYFIQRDFSSNTKFEMAQENNAWKDAKSIYEFSAKDIDGNVVNLSKYK